MSFFMLSWGLFKANKVSRKEAKTFAPLRETYYFVITIDGYAK